MSVPNDASSELLNDYQIYDSVAVVERGNVCVCVCVCVCVLGRGLCYNPLSMRA